MVQAPGWPPSDPTVERLKATCGYKSKKVAESFGGFRKKRYLCRELTKDRL